jgi:hypothetical protein
MAVPASADPHPTVIAVAISVVTMSATRRTQADANVGN